MKTNRRKYNTLVIHELFIKYGYTKMFIRQCIKGERNSVTAIKIAEEYKVLSKKIDHLVIKTLKNNE
ncbi:hypothetical protein [Flavobacterium sp. HSC-61S13]|uniref:hypothetical protein n=1 Tax=Flavobacterium sp. HSC-61S13 TaxID=2910963 RepID=UPI00209F0671|nr:hypothetical protein [Flavobacterium sp. HSC-61S13]MCP1996839.1 hypothetical protein [Flavobacterium sp. HSC-61S13]